MSHNVYTHTGMFYILAMPILRYAICPTYQRVMSHISMSRVPQCIYTHRHVLHFSNAYFEICNMSHISKSHVPYINESCPTMCAHTQVFVTSQQYLFSEIQYVPHINESCSIMCVLFGVCLACQNFCHSHIRNARGFPEFVTH